MIPLSDAIALGRTMIKPRKGFIFCGPGPDEGCALGMALIASGIRCINAGSLLGSMWPWLSRHSDQSPCTCICTSLDPVKAASIIGHLFDIHVMSQADWTLDQLIDWVRSVEPAEPEEVIEAQPEPARVLVSAQKAGV